MKAGVWTKYGPPEVLQIKELEKPVPKDKELLIKVYATTATSGDCKVRRGDPFAVRFFYGLRKPKIPVLGSEFAGRIEAIGKDVKHFTIGDSVFGGTGARLGTNAEYVCVNENGAIAFKPSNTTFDEAAAVPFGATTSLFFLRDKGHIKQGQHVLIYGASGALGTYAVQLAKWFGAEVTAVCSSANVELVKALGADRVIDYTKEDYAKTENKYDIIFDTVGKTSFAHGKGALKANGVFLAAAAGLGEYRHMVSTSIGNDKKMIGGVASMRKEDMIFLKELIEAGKISSVIDRRYPLEHLAEAHRYVETGHKKGTVVITMEHFIEDEDPSQPLR